VTESPQHETIAPRPGSPERAQLGTPPVRGSSVAAPHLAQVNIGTPLYPLDHPGIADFMDNLGLVNGLGEAAPGFVWRLQTADGDATGVQVFDDPRVIINLTVWESIEDLRAFAYRGTHRDFFKRRLEWFEADGSATALWWIPAGQLPDEHDARRRIEFIAKRGSSPYAFEIGKKQPKLVIDSADLTGDVAQSLIADLNAHLSDLYRDPASNFFHLSPEQVAPGSGLFLVATLDDTPVACGAYRRLGEDTAEVKRMYVAPQTRGLKLGAAILSELEAHAIRAGIERMVLETGPLQHEALGLYDSFGYRPIPAFGEYACAPASICFEHVL
jgi:GNAT superfamily N-acetyltransferase